MTEKKPVPPYKWNGGAFNPQQSGFFRRWKNAWDRGEALEIKGQTDYLKCYLFYLAIEPPYESVLSELLFLRESYGDKIDYLHNKIADCYILLNRFVEAFETLKQLIQLGTRQVLLASTILSLKLLTGHHIEGKELLSLYGPKLTTFGKDHLDYIAEYLDIMLEQYERENEINLIAEWAKNAHSYSHRISYNISLADGFTVENVNTNLKLYSFRDCSGAQIFAKEITRLAENIVREDADLPHVGAGWLSEMKLYQQIKRSLPDFEVKDHNSPNWLGSQHLDIFIPELQIALEYQGKQHDEPVEFFGGKEAFEKTQERDARKKRLCTKHGVHIIYVRPGYEISDILNEISAHSTQKISFVESFTALSGKPPKIKDAISGKLREIDANAELERVTYEYELPPELYVEPIEFDPNYKVSPKIVKRHLSLGDEIREIYKQRKTNPDGVDRVIELCKQQIELSVDIAHYRHQDRLKLSAWCLQQADKFSNDAKQSQEYVQKAQTIANSRLMGTMYYSGYNQLIIIYENQHKFEEALKLAIKARAYYWDTEEHWDKIIVRMLTRMGK